MTTRSHVSSSCVAAALVAAALASCGGEQGSRAPGPGPVGALVAAAGEGENDSGGTTRAAAQTSGPSQDLAPFAGHYPLLDARRTLNECPVDLTVGVTEIVVFPEQAILHTMGEDRSYGARVVESELIGEARFDSYVGAGDACPDSTFFERWRLRRGDGGALSGIHEAIWAFPPNCARPCTVRFEVRTGPSSPLAPGERPPSPLDEPPGMGAFAPFGT